MAAKNVHLSNIAIALIVLSAVVMSGCVLTPEDFGGRAEAHLWEEFATGQVAGADIAHDLGFGSVSAQPEVEASLKVWRNRFAADWGHLDRSEDGTAKGNFQFAGQAIPFSSRIHTHVNADLVRGTYGFILGPEVFSVTPMLGASWVDQKTDIAGTGMPTILGATGAGVPVSAQSKDHQVFPIAGLRLDSLPLDWLSFEGQVAGFGIPEGQIVDAQTMMGIRFYHATIDAGYRYLRFDFGDTHIRLKGLMVGGGVYF